MEAFLFLFLFLDSVIGRELSQLKSIDVGSRSRLQTKLTNTYTRNMPHLDMRKPSATIKESMAKDLKVQAFSFPPTKAPVTTQPSNFPTTINPTSEPTTRPTTNTNILSPLTAFSYSGFDQQITIPVEYTWVTEITVYLWGAGGGNGYMAGGGSGAFVTGNLKVYPGQQFTLVIGQAGYNGISSGANLRTYGGGGAGSGNRGSGGGRSSIMFQGNDIVTAGGGGGGGNHGGAASAYSNGQIQTTSYKGGTTDGTTNPRIMSTTCDTDRDGSGGGGSIWAGGCGSNICFAFASSSGNFRCGDGSKYQGGSICATASMEGGGGGGGYYGGGAGVCGGGGGGSSFFGNLTQYEFSADGPADNSCPGIAYVPVPYIDVTACGAMSQNGRIVIEYVNFGINPTTQPTTLQPSSPTIIPSTQPFSSTVLPSRHPSISPSRYSPSLPTYKPTTHSPFIVVPVNLPSFSAKPTRKPLIPSAAPLIVAGNNPSFVPSEFTPSLVPSSTPSAKPTDAPSVQPSSSLLPTTPTVSPTIKPSFTPSESPSRSPTFSPSGQPTGQPSGQPTSSPSCGLGKVHTKDGIAKGKCGPCPPGTYDPFAGSPVCVVCPVDMYQSQSGMTSCNTCAFPQRTVGTESSTCAAFGIVAETRVLAPMLSFVALLFLLGLWAVSDAGEQSEEAKGYWIRSRKAAVFLNLLLPMMDAITNLAYIMTQRFYREFLFYLAIVFVFHSTVVFAGKLNRLYALPMSPITYAKKLLWLGRTTARKEQERKLAKGEITPEHMDRNYADNFPVPTIYGYLFCIVPCNAHENLFLVLWEFVGWIVAIVLQCASVVLIAAYPLFIMVWLVVGMVMQVIKVIAVGRVWNVWFQVWTGDESFSIPSSIIVDTEDFNGSQLIQFLCESIPNLVLQLLNSLLMEGRLDTLTILSIVSSGFMVINGIYIYIYYRYFYKQGQRMGFKDIPMDKTVDINIGLLGININFIYARLECQNKNWSKLTKVGHNRFLNTFSITKHDNIQNNDSSELMEISDINSDKFPIYNGIQSSNQNAADVENVNPYFKRPAVNYSNKKPFKVTQSMNTSYESQSTNSNIDTDPSDVQFGTVYVENQTFFNQGNEVYVVGAVKQRLDHVNSELEQVDSKFENVNTELELNRVEKAEIKQKVQKVEQANSEFKQQFEQIVRVNSELENRIKFLEAKIDSISSRTLL